MGRIPIAGIWRTTAHQDDLWAVIADLSTWPAWWPAIREVEVLEGTRERPKRARIILDAPRPLRPLRIDLEIVEHLPPRRLTLRTADGPLTGNGELDVAADDAGSQVTYDLTLTIQSFLLRPLELVLAGATRASGRQRLRRAGDDLARLAGGEPLNHEP